MVARQEIAVNETELSEDQSKLDTSNEQLREREQEITRQRGDVESLSAQLNFIQQKYLEQKDLDYPEYDRVRRSGSPPPRGVASPPTFHLRTPLISLSRPSMISPRKPTT